MKIPNGSIVKYKYIKAVADSLCISKDLNNCMVEVMYYKNSELDGHSKDLLKRFNAHNYYEVRLIGTNLSQTVMDICLIPNSNIFKDVIERFRL